MDDFARKYEEEVSSLDDLVLSVHHVDLPDYGVGTAYVLETGYVAWESLGKWTLFETSAKAFDKRYFGEWSNFPRGAWLDRVPTAPGWYATRDRDLGKMGFRRLEVVHGKLLDTTGGFVRKGLVTEFVGQWWSERVPALKNSF